MMMRGMKRMSRIRWREDDNDTMNDDSESDGNGTMNDHSLTLTSCRTSSVATCDGEAQ
jgi:hypothetical protein